MQIGLRSWPQRLLAAFLASGIVACATAASADAYVYWSNSNGTTVGRAELDGSHGNQSFIAGGSFPFGVAVDGAHVYWANEPGGNTGTIGRANLNGSGANQFLIGLTTAPVGLAVDGAHIYWGNNSGGELRVGRANLDGSTVKEDFIHFANG